MNCREVWLAIILGLLGITFSLTALFMGRFYSPLAATYALPDESWRVTTYQTKRGQVFVRIEIIPKKEEKK